MAKQSDRRRYTREQEAERAVLSVLADWPLKPGQMLLLGPKSVKILSTPGAFKGELPDMMVIEKSTWNSAST